VFWGQVGECRVYLKGSVVDEDIEPAECLNDFGDGRFEKCLFANIARNAACAPALGLDR